MLVAWLFLIFCVWISLFTLNAFHPIRKNRLLYVASFFASWMTIELSWMHVVWELVVVIVFAWFGAFEHWAAWLGLVVLVANWVGLAVLYFTSRGATELAELALADLTDEEPSPEHPQGVKRTKNVPYTRTGGRTLKLDVFEPKQTVPSGTRRPAILQIHGGGWVIGDKREQGIPLLKYLVSRGWVGFNANYRLSPGATFPDHLVDLKEALIWIREHAEDYGVDPGFVAVTGGSAGGHLTAMMALTEDQPEYQPRHPGADTSVQAAVPLYGIYDFTNRLGTQSPEFLSWIIEPLVMKKFLADEPEAFAKASPLDCIRPDTPPMFVIHGDRDTLAPVEDAREFVTRAGPISENPVYYLELHGAQHAFDVFSSVRTRRVVRAIHRFLGAMHARYLADVDASESTAAEPEMPEEVTEITQPADVEAAKVT